MGSFSIWHWLIVLLIVVMVFGTKKLKKGFKDGMKDGSADAAATTTPPAGQVANNPATDKTTIDVEAKQKS